MTRFHRLLMPSAAAASVALVLAASGAASGAPGAPQTPGAVVASTGPTGATATGTAPTLTASVSDCHADTAPANRSATFTAETTWVPGTITMEVKFQLEERTGAATSFEPVTLSSPGFNVWSSSSPPKVGQITSNFIDNEHVTGLAAPAAFRVLVHARWIGRRGRVIHTMAALSPVCLQPLLEPDLVIGRITRVAGATAGTTRYTVEVHNAGGALAGPFAVSLSIGTTALEPVDIAGLPAGTSAPAVFTGPACTAGTTLTAVADPTSQVVEPADPLRTRTLDCPIR